MPKMFTAAAVCLLFLAPPQAAFSPLVLRTRAFHGQRASPLNVLRDVTDTRSISEMNPDDESALPVMDHRDLDIFDLLLQRSIQGLCQQKQAAGETVKALWLTRFFNHTHLDSGKEWHSVLGMRVHFTDYLREMFRLPGHDFMVVDEDPQEIQGVKMETVEPAIVAQSLVEVVNQLSQQWIEDLELFADHDSLATRKRMTRVRKYLRTKLVAANAESTDWRHIKPTIAAYDRTSSLFLLESSRKTADASALRRWNADLLQKTTTLLALKSLLKEMSQGAMKDPQFARELIWLDDFSRPWLAELTSISTADTLGNPSGDPEKTVADEMFQAMSLRPPSIVSETLVDPPGIAERLYGHRETIALSLAEELRNNTAAKLADVYRDRLERSYQLEFQTSESS